MGDRRGDAAKPPLQQSFGGPSRSFVVRIWFEETEGRQVLRGTLGELGGRPLGAFDSIAALASLLLRVLETPPS